MSENISGPGLAGAVDLSGLVNQSRTKAEPSTTSGDLVRDVDDRGVVELVELSKTVPVILEFYGGKVEPVLAPVILSFDGKFVLGTVQSDSAPELVQALKIEGIPSVVALIGGQPLPLLKGIPSAEEVKQILNQVLTFAKENGVTGVMSQADNSGAETPPDEATSNQPHPEALEALQNNDLQLAASLYEKAIKEAPADDDAKIGLLQVQLLQRVQKLVPEAVRQEAARLPDSISCALDVADLDLAGGNPADAFARLLEVFSSSKEEDRETIRERLIAYFTIVGHAAPEVKKARAQLASLMF